jgi:tungstate transport system substrate-binding protein
MKYIRMTAALLALLLAPLPVHGAERFITLASTTSTQNSGLFDHLLPLFEGVSGIAVHVLAVGTGQALRLGRNGDADLILVHHRPGEEAFVAEGHGIRRYDLMANDFVIVGPAADPAGIGGLKDAARALRRLAGTETPFASRGDDSGTHRREMALWRAAGVDPRPASGRWYRETGSGMGATLNTAAAMNAHALADRATWLKFANKGSLKILVAGDPRLINPYGVVQVDPRRHPHVKAKEARAFIDWLLSGTGQAAIAAYRIQGRQVFFPACAPGLTPRTGRAPAGCPPGASGAAPDRGRSVPPG